MDLAQYDEPEVEDALIKTILDDTEDEDLLETVAGALGEVWWRKKAVRIEVLRRLGGVPGQVLTRLLDKRWPEWRSDSHA